MCIRDRQIHHSQLSHSGKGPDICALQSDTGAASSHADACGLSLIHIFAARHMGLEVCGISCITNLAAGLSDKKLNHKEVQETADRVAKQFTEPVSYTHLIFGFTEFEPAAPANAADVDSGVFGYWFCQL